MKRLKALFALLLMLAATTGCWSSREIQNVNYPAAIGVDYEEGNYIVYVQLLDFSSVAKLEGQQKKEETPVWVGKGIGKSFTDAVNHLYETSQQQVTWGHVEAVVFSERILKLGRYREALELIDRYREIRYLNWAFSTRESLDEVLSVTPFFRLSPKSSILHNPFEHYRQRSMVRPIRLYEFIMALEEKPRTAYLPSLKINRTQWKESRQEHALLEYDGLHLLQYKRPAVHMKLAELEGVPWVNNSTVRISLSIGRGDELAAVLVMEAPEIDIRHTIRNGRAYFDINVNVKAVINEQFEEMTEGELAKMAGQKIEEQIRNTYTKAYRRKVDIYNLGETLYRHNPAAFHRLADENQFVLHEDALRNVHVNVHLTSTGRYKFHSGIK
jgi:Ger(x)C family germination protein